MKVNVRSNIDEFNASLDKVAKKQMPYATSKAINEVAKKAKGAIEKEIKAKVDSPTAFTTKGAFISYSNKNQSPIQAIVGVKDKQAGYLKYVEEGGVSPAKGRAKPVPTSSSKNKYGNLARGITKKVGQGKVFSGTPRGGRPGGIYQRMGTKKNPKLKMLASWHKSTQHDRRMRMGERVRLIVNRNMDKELRKQVSAAIKSAR